MTLGRTSHVHACSQVWKQQADGTYSLVHSSYVCEGDGPCEDGSSDWHVQHDSLASVQAASSIPVYGAGQYVRMTYWLGRLFSDCDEHFDYLRTVTPQLAARLPGIAA